MSYYPERALGFSNLTKIAFRFYLVTLKQAAPFIFLIVLVKQFCAAFEVVYKTGLPNVITNTVTVAIIIFLLSAIILSAHRAFSETVGSFLKIFVDTVKNTPRIFITTVFFIVGCIGFYGLIELAHKGLHQLFPAPSAIHGVMLFILTIISLVYVFMFILSVPLVVIQQCGIFKSFLRSALLSEKNITGVIVLFFFSLLLISFISKGLVLREYFVPIYYLDVVYDFVVLCIGIPLLTNILLLVLHDSELNLRKC
ncbi:MAG: hypothetical protein A3C44_02660 [Gammaproteobacteria bacterium RIFCSPHIGHO2_02_FULL_39_13]|nr:MAG: hypothetical protein A3C44_02660 [Gammaproteobacteria bacterium RIFCSPHIGHO2_02_FULL_39_13]OGT50166.1 MAG: hypothetical protein A3E53_01965 [Gammaproteobacteria bacterium RIFCSPHIGHO2_12_FULL_39_24]